MILVLGNEGTDTEDTEVANDDELQLSETENIQAECNARSSHL